jgi:hypothetical protein
VNRHFWVVIDSDLESEGQTLNVTKMRVRDALAAYQGRGGSWATLDTWSRTTCRQRFCRPRLNRFIPLASQSGRASVTSTRSLLGELAGYLPGKRLTIAVVSTVGIDGNRTGENVSRVIFQRIAKRLAPPSNPVAFPG